MVRILKDNYATIDALDQFLESSGYEGTINDKMFQYLRDNGQTGSLADMIPAFSGSTILLDNFVDNLDQTPPSFSFESDTAGTATWDFHSGASAPSAGAGDIKTGTFAVSVGVNSGSFNFDGYEAETGYIYIRVGNSNVLKSQVITIPGVQVSPTVTDLVPADGSSPILTTALQMTFSEEIVTTGTAAVVTVKKVSDDSTVATYDPDTQGTWSSGNTVWQGPAASWTDGEALYVNYSGFEDVVGNTVAPVTNNTDWNFTPISENVVDTILLTDFGTSNVTVSGDTITIVPNSGNDVIGYLRISTYTVPTLPGNYTLKLNASATNCTNMLIHWSFFDNPDGNLRENFDLSTGTVDNTNTDGGAGVDCRISDNGDGTYACEFDFEVTADGTGDFRIYPTDYGNTLGRIDAAVGNESLTLTDIRLVQR